MKYYFFAAAIALLPLLPAAAHEGHVHEAAAPSPTAKVDAQQTPSPRIEARTPEFELVAMLDGSVLVVWLDRTASNQPVTDAVIDVSGAVTGTMRLHDDGAYHLAAPALGATGDHVLVFTVTTPDGGDLLNGTLMSSAPAVLSPTIVPVVPAAPLVVAALAVGLGAFWVRRRRGS